MNYSDFTNNVDFLAYESPSESNATQKIVWRVIATPTNLNRSEFESFMHEFKGDIVILRTLEPFLDTNLDRSKWDSIDCGLLTYWGTQNLVRKNYESQTCKLIPANARIDEFEEVVRSSFIGYTNHYSFNAMFDSISPTEAYVDWAVRAAVAKDPNSHALLLVQNDVSVGSILAHKNENEFEIQLAGIHADFQRRGLYTQMIEKFWSQLVLETELPMVISTQIENRAVQSAWMKLGLTEEFRVFTTHIVRK